MGGPTNQDEFLDDRAEYHYTEVALDYNAGFTAALAALVASPPGFWDVDCATYIPKYPWK